MCALNKKLRGFHDHSQTENIHETIHVMRDIRGPSLSGTKWDKIGSNTLNCTYVSISGRRKMCEKKNRSKFY